jgi:hypothetical protein
MNCQNHPEVLSTAFCRTCGKPLCDQCRRDALGTVFCAEHLPAPANPVPGAAPWAPPPPAAGVPPGAGPSGAVPPLPGSYAADVSPGLAFFLGWIPGVGAIYNGQYAKGLVHAIVWGVLVSIISSGGSNGLEPIFGMLIAAWMFYMAFEAYHTARKRKYGEPVDEYSSLIDLGGRRSNLPVAALALIVLGVLLLLHTLDILNMEYVARYWPVLLIAAGAWLLYGRLAGHQSAPPEVRHERQ